METGIIEVPMRVNVPDQVLPVNFIFKAKLTTCELIFDPPRLDFGKCPLSESVVCALKVTNPSKLTQKFGFVNLPAEIKIEPQKGFGTLLPDETVELTVRWSPSFVGPGTAALTVSRAPRGR
eukprot:2791859-Pyramimonas_sp.AAC.2